MSRRATVVRWSLGLLAAACTSKPAPVATVRLTEALPDAVALPSPPKRPPPARLDAPLAADAGRAAWVVPVERNRSEVVRCEQAVGPPPVVWSLTQGALEALGDLPDGGGVVPFDPPFGTRLAALACEPPLDGREVCQRFERLSNDVVALAVELPGLGHGPLSLSVAHAQLEDTRAVRGPQFTGLVRRSTGWSPEHTVLTLSALAARDGDRYRFRVVLPDQPVLRFATGMEAGQGGAPVRLRLLQGDQLLLDEVVARDRGWQTHEVPLKGKAGDLTELTLESAALPGQLGVARGLWGAPRIIGARKHPNIVLVSWDATRPDHLSAYGYGRETTPTLSKLARLGTRFDRAYAQVPQTWESLLSLLSGRYPIHNGVWKRGTFVSPDVQLLPDLLSKQGYDTYVGSDIALYPETRLSSFDLTDQLPEAPGKPKPAVAAQLPAILPLLKHGSAFIWFHLEDAHYPLKPHDPGLFATPGVTGRYASVLTSEDLAYHQEPGTLTAFEHTQIKDLYDSALHDADAQLAAVLAAIEAADAEAETILVFTADHGELMDEHGATLTHSLPWEDVLHVPLIIAYPGKWAPGAPVQQKVELVDLVPTLLSLAELPVPPDLDGRDLTPLMRGEPLPERNAYAQYNGALFSMIKGDERVLWTLNHTTVAAKGKTFSFPPLMLFNLKDDPRELHDLAAEAPDRAEALRRELEGVVADWSRSRQSGEAISQSARDMLRAAGYLPPEAVDAGALP